MKKWIIILLILVAFLMIVKMKCNKEDKTQREIIIIIRNYLDMIAQKQYSEFSDVCISSDLADSILWTKNNYEENLQKKGIPYNLVNYYYNIKKVNHDDRQYKITFDYSLSFTYNHNQSSVVLFYDNIITIEKRNNQWIIIDYYESP